MVTTLIQVEVLSLRDFIDLQFNVNLNNSRYVQIVG